MPTHAYTSHCHAKLPCQRVAKLRTLPSTARFQFNDKRHLISSFTANLGRVALHAGKCGSGGLPPSHTGLTNFEEDGDPRTQETCFNFFIWALSLWMLSFCVDVQQALADPGDALAMIATGAAGETRDLRVRPPSDDTSTIKRILRDVLADQVALKRRLHDVEPAANKHLDDTACNRLFSVRGVQHDSAMGKTHVSHVLTADAAFGLVATPEKRVFHVVGSRGCLYTTIIGDICKRMRLLARIVCARSGLSLSKVMLKTSVKKGIDVFLFPVGGKIMDAMGANDECKGDIPVLACLLVVGECVVLPHVCEGMANDAGVGLFDQFHQALPSTQFTQGVAARLRCGELSGIVGVFGHPQMAEDCRAGVAEQDHVPSGLAEALLPHTGLNNSMPQAPGEVSSEFSLSMNHRGIQQDVDFQRREGGIRSVTGGANYSFL